MTNLELSYLPTIKKYVHSRHDKINARIVLAEIASKFIDTFTKK